MLRAVSLIQPFLFNIPLQEILKSGPGLYRSDYLKVNDSKVGLRIKYIVILAQQLNNTLVLLQNNYIKPTC